MKQKHSQELNEMNAKRNKSLCAVEQFHSDASLEAVDQRALNNSKNWQWTMEGEVSAQRSTPSPHDDESRLNLWDHDGRIRVRWYASERCLPECVIERYNGLTPRVMIWGAISYHGRSNLLRIEGNLNSNGYVCEVLYSLKSFPSFKSSLELSSCSFKRRTFAAHTSNMEFSSTSRHLKSV
ncbi:uncharacterized protein TNCV_1611681 [Trichonephila clavipes]|nr:uncharacterized protein TNCV_1611681 [Trichonephila clavipes]